KAAAASDLEKAVSKKKEAQEASLAAASLRASREDALKVRTLFSNVVGRYAAQRNIDAKKWLEYTISFWKSAKEKGSVGDYLGTLLEKGETLGSLWSTVEKSAPMFDRDRQEMEKQGVDLKRLDLFSRFAFMAMMSEQNPFFQEQIGTPKDGDWVKYWTPVLHGLWDAKKAVAEAGSPYKWHRHDINDADDWILFTWSLYAQKKGLPMTVETLNGSGVVQGANGQPAMDTEGKPIVMSHREQVESVAAQFSLNNLGFYVEFFRVPSTEVRRGIAIAQETLKIELGREVQGADAVEGYFTGKHIRPDMDFHLADVAMISARLEDMFRRRAPGETAINETVELARAREVRRLKDKVTKATDRVMGGVPVELMGHRVISYANSLEAERDAIVKQLAVMGLSPEKRAELELKKTELDSALSVLIPRREVKKIQLRESLPHGMAQALQHRIEGYQFSDPFELQTLQERPREDRVRETETLIDISFNLYPSLKEFYPYGVLNPWDSTGKGMAWLMGIAESIMEDYETWKELFNEDGTPKDAEKIRKFFGETLPDITKANSTQQFSEALLKQVPELRYGIRNEDFNGAVANGLTQHMWLNPLLDVEQIGKVTQRMNEFLKDPSKVQTAILHAEREMRVLNPTTGSGQGFLFSRRNDIGTFMSLFLNAAEEGFDSYMWKHDRVLDILENDQETVKKVMAIANKVREAKGISERITPESFATKRSHLNLKRSNSPFASLPPLKRPSEMAVVLSPLMAA
ncbi:MAG: hypothetical protein WCJ71_10675, partial [Candidatus Omnitrophota bacterium]